MNSNFESAKYYKGNGSPISTCKYEKGYSRAWLHHIGRNKHHHEYWHEYLALDDAPIIPYVYTVELICDGLAAGIVYMGKNWTSIYQYNYYKKKSISYKINPLTNKFIEEVFLDISKYGINKVINKSYLKNKYKTLVLNDKDYKEY